MAREIHFAAAGDVQDLFALQNTTGIVGSTHPHIDRRNIVDYDDVCSFACCLGTCCGEVVAGLGSKSDNPAWSPRVLMERADDIGIDAERQRVCDIRFA